MQSQEFHKIYTSKTVSETHIWYRRQYCQL